MRLRMTWSHLVGASVTSSDPKPGMDAELFRVLSKAEEELGLQWSPPEEPTHSRLYEYFLPRRHQAKSPGRGAPPSRPAYVPPLPPPS